MQERHLADDVLILLKPSSLEDWRIRASNQNVGKIRFL